MKTVVAVGKYTKNTVEVTAITPNGVRTGCKGNLNNPTKETVTEAPVVVVPKKEGLDNSYLPLIKANADRARLQAEIDRRNRMIDNICSIEMYENKAKKQSLLKKIVRLFV